MADFPPDPLLDSFGEFRDGGEDLAPPEGFAGVLDRARRRRHHRTASLLATSLLVVATVAAGTGYGVLHGAGHLPRHPPSSSPAGPDAPGPCRSGLTATVRQHGSMSSRPYAVIALTNTSGTSCRLSGYPALAATGHPVDGSAGDQPLELTVTDGPISEVADPGPHQVDLAPGAAATFAVGTATAYQGGAHLYQITQLHITVPDASAPVPLALTLDATAPAGQPFPVSVTALAAG